MAKKIKYNRESELWNAKDSYYKFYEWLDAFYQANICLLDFVPFEDINWEKYPDVFAMCPTASDSIKEEEFSEDYFATDMWTLDEEDALTAGECFRDMREFFNDTNLWGAIEEKYISMKPVQRGYLYIVALRDKTPYGKWLQGLYDKNSDEDKVIIEAEIVKRNIKPRDNKK